MKTGVRSQESGVRIAALALLTGAVCFGALDPVSWTLTSDVSKAAPGAAVSLRLTAKIDDGWHIYSVTSPPPTIPLKITFDGAVAHVFQPKPDEKFDEALGAKAQFYEKEAVFQIPYELKKDAAAGPLEITAQVRYAACDSKRCLPPKTKQAAFTLSIDGSAPSAAAFAAPAGYIDTAAPVRAPAAAPKASEGMLAFLLTAFGLALRIAESVPI